MSKKLILITIDCLRRDRLRVFGYDKNIMPNINKLANEAVCFDNAIANGSYTAASFYSLFTSEIPSINPPYAPLPNSKTTIYKILQQYNIKTSGIHSNPHLGEFCNYNVGFDDFFDMFKKPEFFSQPKKRYIYKIYFLFYSISERLFIKKYIKKIKSFFFKFVKNRIKISSTSSNEGKSPYLDTKNITYKAIQWLKDNYNSDFFLWIHYMDAHRPYNPPEDYLVKTSHERISQKDKKYMNNAVSFLSNIPNYIEKINKEKVINVTQILYHAELNFIDHYLGILFQYLKKLGIYHEINIVLTSDHGDELLEHDFLGHNGTLYDELLRIPLLIKLEQSKFLSKIINNQVQLIDVAPSILDIFELPKEPAFNGTSLLPLIKQKSTNNNSNYCISLILHNKNITYNVYRKDDYIYYPLVSCRTLKWKLIYDDQNKEIKLFNIEKDSLELNNVSNSNIEDVKRVKKTLYEKIRPYITIYQSEESKISRVLGKIKF